jgi:hypothetical protein
MEEVAGAKGRVGSWNFDGEGVSRRGFRAAAFDLPQPKITLRKSLLWPCRIAGVALPPRSRPSASG